jgi:hypothetical protein
MWGRLATCGRLVIGLPQALPKISGRRRSFAACRHAGRGAPPPSGSGRQSWHCTRPKKKTEGESLGKNWPADLLRADSLTRPCQNPQTPPVEPTAPIPSIHKQLQAPDEDSQRAGITEASCHTIAKGCRLAHKPDSCFDLFQERPPPLPQHQNVGSSTRVRDVSHTSAGEALKHPASGLPRSILAERPTPSRPPSTIIIMHT